MIRYIDAGTARQHLSDRLMESALNNVGIKADADEVFRDIAENRLPVWIDELQTYDVQEVRRGKWMILKSYPNVLLCSECNTPYEKKEFVATPNYCPNCGARMLERSEEC